MKLRYALGFIGRGKRKQAADKAVVELRAMSMSASCDSRGTISYTIEDPYLLDGFRPRALGRTRRQLFGRLEQRIIDGLDYQMSVSVKSGYTNVDFSGIVVTCNPIK